jgi:predicted O-linked N-acetylglucosamine transferase (SPINDLY family)
MTQVSLDQAMLLAIAHHKAGRRAEAETIYRQILAANPNHPDALHMLGVLAAQSGHDDQAAELIQKAIAIAPNNPAYHLHFGQSLQNLGQLDRAIASYQNALRLQGDLAQAHYNLGIAWTQRHQLDRAALAYREAIAINPDYAPSHNNLGMVLTDMERFDEAIASLNRAVELDPKSPLIHNNLARALKELGRLEEATACRRRALEVDPTFVIAHNDLLGGMRYDPSADPATILAAANAWNLRHARPLARFILPHDNNRDPDRPLHIGYVSSDFHDHASAFFLLPLFRNHDHRRFEITCYAEVARPDAFTTQMQEQVSRWRSTIGRTDADVAAQIRGDRIDILVDLKLHTAHNRLLVLALKPAPVQVTWLGYPGTTGMDTIDYRLTDPYLDPPGLDDAFYAERSMRLPDTFWCYDPLTDHPAVNELPCLKSSSLTFGSLNHFQKVNDSVMSLWSKVLLGVPNSRLLMMTPRGSARQAVLDRLAKLGIASDRVDFVATQPRHDYLRTYHGIDIALDTLPYNGHTTSFDAFWMGVPVVTMAGRNAFGRAGVSLLTNLRMPELIARTPERFVQIAVDLAHDRPRLAELRRTLRQRMRSSPLMDARAFARGIESAYRTMWQTWCTS